LARVGAADHPGAARTRGSAQIVAVALLGARRDPVTALAAVFLAGPQLAGLGIAVGVLVEAARAAGLDVAAIIARAIALLVLGVPPAVAAAAPPRQLTEAADHHADHQRATCSGDPYRGWSIEAHRPSISHWSR